MANIPHLNILDIAQVESQFLIAFPYAYAEMDNQVMLKHLISYSFHDKVQWLADNPGIYDLALKRAKESRKVRFNQ